MMSNPHAPGADSPPPTITMPRLDDDTVVQILEFLHRIMDLFEDRYGDQIRRFHEDLGGPGDINDLDDPPF